MKTSKILLLCVLMIVYAAPAQSASYPEPRFGPWVYFAPYYFPPDDCCCGYCFGPMDFLPQYESPNPPIPSHDVGACLNCGEPDPYPRKIRPRRRASRPAPSIAPVPRLRESRPAALIAPEPRLNERRPAASEQGVSRPPSTGRTGIPASITSPPPQTSEALSNANNLRPPRAVSRPAPQTTDPGTGNPSRPFRWGQARER